MDLLRVCCRSDSTQEVPPAIARGQFIDCLGPFSFRLPDLDGGARVPATGFVFGPLWQIRSPFPAMLSSSGTFA